MLGDAILYAARRATSTAIGTAIGNVERKATWMAVASVFLLSALVSGLILAYQFIATKVGSLSALGLISVACVLVGLICLSLPGIIERAERRRAAHNRNAASVATAVAGVDNGARQAVDHFRALRVVGAAFLFGLAAARRLKS
jgi:uncharacterized membrane protein YedE/YeeE